MRYGLGIGNKIVAIKAATEGSYRFVMLAMMAIELILLGVLVCLEALHK